MKAVPALLLSAFAFSVTAAPVFCEEPTPYFEIPADAPEPVQAVLSKCNAMVAALQRCTDALGTVDGKESADAVAAVLQQEMRVICSLRDECVEIFAANQDVFPPESDEFAGEVVLSSIALRTVRGCGIVQGRAGLGHDRGGIRRCPRFGGGLHGVQRHLHGSVGVHRLHA